MAQDLHEAFESVKALYAEASDTLGYDVAKLSFEGPKEELDQTVKTQPCLLVASVALFTVLDARGVKAGAMAGHSLGEYSALVAAGALSFRDAVRTTERRGHLMQQAVPEGTGLMAAVLGLEREAVETACADVKSGYVAPANYNCPGQVVISGEKPAVEEAMELLKEAGAKRVVPLAVSVPSHSRLMDGASQKLLEFFSVENIGISGPGVPVVGNASAEFLSSADSIRKALADQLNHPVLWEDCVATLVREGVDTFVEVGPGKVLAGLIRRINPDVTVLNVQDRESMEKALPELVS
jgi:[acyl-carrier-protein] S-malonyltransferase